MQDLGDIRKDYAKARLDVTSVNPDPIVQFEQWLNDAINASVPEPTAMHLATVDTNGRPSSRIVLLKGIDQSRLRFYTNYQSRKGKELDSNPACALTFFWPELERQVRIEGTVERTDTSVSDAYFKSRPRESQIGAWASPQSTLIKDRNILEQRVGKIQKKFEGLNVLPRPNQWGGYQVNPLVIEFWQGRPSRLHDRIQFSMVEGKWKIFRLAP